MTLDRNLWRFTGDNSSLDPGDTIVVPIIPNTKSLSRVGVRSPRSFTSQWYRSQPW